MGHEDRQGHLPQDMPGGLAQHRLAVGHVVGTHDQQVDPFLAGMVEEQVAQGEVGGEDIFRARLDAVPGQE